MTKHANEEKGAGEKPARIRYVPAVGPRLRRLLAVIFFLFALIVVNSVYLVTVTVAGARYQNWFYLNMFLLHLVLGLMIVLPVIVFGAAHIRNSHDRPNRRAVRVGYALFTTALLTLGTGLLLMRVDLFGYRFDLSAPLARQVTYWAHDRGPGRRDLAVHPPSARGTADPLEGRRRVGRGGRGVRGGDACSPDAGPAKLERRRPRLRSAVLLSLALAHLDRQLHPGRGPPERRVLPRVSRRHPPGLVPQRAPAQLVQQPGVPLLCAPDAAGDDGSRRRRAGEPVLRGLPRSRAVLQRRVRRAAVRRSRLRPVTGRHGPGRDHLHDVSCHHPRQQRAGQRRLHDRGARPLPVHVQREPLPAPGSTGSSSRRSRSSTSATFPQAAAQDDGVLRHLSQGAPARRS